MPRFAALCEKSWSKELAGNLARHQLGIMLVNNKQVAEGIKKLNAITPEYTGYIAIQNLIADECFKADADMVPPFADRRPRRNGPRALPRAARPGCPAQHPRAPTTPDADQYRMYYQARSRLGLDACTRFKKFKEMKDLADPLLLKVGTVVFHDQEKLNGDIREHFRTQLMKVQSLATVGLVETAFKAGDFKVACLRLVDPEVASSEGFAPMALVQGRSRGGASDARRKFLGMGLQANIQINATSPRSG